MASAEISYLQRPYNRYNLFFILERERLIQTRTGPASKDTHSTSQVDDLMSSKVYPGYETVQLPPLPPRFQDIVLPQYWYVPIKREKRRLHRKSHGVASFQELASSIADSWKTIDDVTLQFLTVVEKITRDIHTSLEKNKSREDNEASEKWIAHKRHMKSIDVDSPTCHPNMKEWSPRRDRRKSLPIEIDTSPTSVLDVEPHRRGTLSYPIVPKLSNRDFRVLSVEAIAPRMRSTSSNETSSSTTKSCEVCSDDFIMELWCADLK